MSSARGAPVTLFRLLVALLLAALHPCLASPLQAHPVSVSHTNTLDGRDALPSPLSVAPDQWWGGIDGAWSTFAFRIGHPSQVLRLLVSTASQQTWAIHSLACVYNETDPKTNADVEKVDANCDDARGHTLNISKSTSWDEVGFYQLWTEKNLGLVGNGEYGYDDVGLGTTDEQGPMIRNTTIGTLISENFWLGHFGVNPKPTNFSAFDDPSPSYMTYLYQQKRIPSLSFGYTAGAKYRFNSVLGSLTLGGYDASRFVPNDLSFGFAPDNERDLVVGVVGITAKTATNPKINLLERDQFSMYIDSTVAEMWLPTEVCRAFEKAFGLKYDNATQLYLVDDALHQNLLATNATVTFNLGQKFSANTTVNIDLPYAAFDLMASPPYKGLRNASRYFPIRRAAKENQFVLGRTFLQEAYLFVDWERQNFSVSQCAWVPGQSQHIVANLADKYKPAANRHGGVGSGQLSTGAIIGAAVGGGFGIALVVCALVWYCMRLRKRGKAAGIAAEAEAAAKTTTSTEKSDDPPLSPLKEDEGTNVFPKAELPADCKSRHELSSDAKDSDLDGPMAEAENSERQIFEMPGDFPTTQEADGRQLSEKESMMVRERIYNGVDPNSPTEASPTSVDVPTRRPAPICPSEVTMFGGGLVNVPSPMTPRTPRDGASLETSDTFFQPPSRTPRDGRYLETEDTLLSPISPLDGSMDKSRKRFSFEPDT